MVQNDHIRSYEYLFNENKGLVYLAVHRFNINDFDRDDLIQVGLMGLLKAAEKFDITLGNKFSTFAIPYIMGAMKKEIHNQKLIKDNYYFRKLQKKIKEFGDQHSIDQLAILCNTSIDNIIIALSRSNKVSLVEQETLNRIIDSSTTNTENNIDLLDKEERKIWYLYYQKNIKQEKIASELAISQSTISRRLKRIKEKVLKD